MADKERRNSLFRSSISINSIRDSATEFSKGLTRNNVHARGIIAVSYTHLTLPTTPYV